MRERCRSERRASELPLCDADSWEAARDHATRSATDDGAARYVEPAGMRGTERLPIGMAATSRHHGSMRST